MIAVIALVFIKDLYSLHKNHISEMGSVSIFRCRHMKHFLLSFFHANMQHSGHCVAYLPLKMKIEIYFCNILAFTYRSRMLDEVQKCLNHLRDNIIERSPSNQGALRIFNGAGGALTLTGV